MRDELRQAGGHEQAARHAGRERGPGSREHRNAGPERIARRRMGVVGQRVQAQIGQPVPRQVLGGRHAPGKDQPIAPDTPPLGFGTQMLRCGGVVLQ